MNTKVSHLNLSSRVMARSFIARIIHDWSARRGFGPKTLKPPRPNSSRLAHVSRECHVPPRTPHNGCDDGDRRRCRSSGPTSSGCQQPARVKKEMMFVSHTTLDQSRCLVRRSNRGDVARRCVLRRGHTYLQFFERETAAETSLEVVSLGRRMHDRAKRTGDRSRERLLSLELTRVAARLLAASCGEEEDEAHLGQFRRRLIASKASTTSSSRGAQGGHAERPKSRSRRRTLVEPGAHAALAVDRVALPILLEVGVR